MREQPFFFFAFQRHCRQHFVWQRCCFSKFY